jgi:hypothetical protein
VRLRFIRAQNYMTARILVHPLCVPAGPRQDVLCDTLVSAGLIDTFIGPPSPKGYRELVRKVSDNPDGTTTYSRMDGSRFVHGVPNCPVAPAA